MQNPALRQEPRERPAVPIPLQRDASILDWLESSGRMLARESTDVDYADDEAEINALMAGEDNSYDADDDDDDVLELEE
ncbi:DUF3134 domain-containing protein [Oculatella sp. LEGE 06141]|uniref:DUF3134 domain-containing protein n=1 Tax=Oculatella sp. LEGE 06141 TaxID=1828648 RepID=UPI001883091F|nr:DUF3134 domain-containing protein [Oculatella sp. LEGE 06141]MBE9181358.1 DUF3134 domain-containing protein [Oculatella sp. LEGE 06141]